MKPSNLSLAILVLAVGVVLVLVANVAPVEEVVERKVTEWAWGEEYDEGVTCRYGAGYAPDPDGGLIARCRVPVVRYYQDVQYTPSSRAALWSGLALSVAAIFIIIRLKEPLEKPSVPIVRPEVPRFPPIPGNFCRECGLKPRASGEYLCEDCVQGYKKRRRSAEFIAFAKK